MRLFAGSVASSHLEAKPATRVTRAWASYRVIVQVQWSPREARPYGQDGQPRSVVLTTVRMGAAE